MARGAALVAATAAAAAFCVALPAFVGTPGSPSPSLRPALRSGATGSTWNATGALYAAAGAIAAVAVTAVLRPAKGSHASRAVCNARRELAVAYEDSGIELLDNGKFAQGLLGSEGAWGRYEYDPLGLSKFTELMPYAREAELKNGRIAMLAWLGLVVPDFFRIPGERYSFEAIPVTIDAHDKLNGAVGVNFQILFWISLVELCCSKKVFEWNSLEVAGDYGLTFLFPADEEGQKKMRISEIKNGRLAMIAFGGAITQAAITRHPFPWLY